MARKTPSFWRRHRVLQWALISVASACVVLAVALVVVARHAEPFLRARIVSGLSEHFHARVELDTFHIAPGNSFHGEWGLWAEGKGLRIWPSTQAGQSSAPAPSQPNVPLIQLDSFRFHVPMQWQFGLPLHINTVRLAGLQIRIPPRPQRAKPTEEHPRLLQSGSTAESIFGRVRIDGVQCTGANLVIESSKPGKLPLEFAILQLKLGSIASDGSMHFQAELTNPRPPGLIQSSGTFGPWVVDDPGESPVAGTYSFDHADLSVFHGIAGILSSKGNYQGILRELVVDGETDTPDFRLTRAGNPLHLQTHFHAIVDGTNGDTDLEPVDATLGQSSFTARGKIVRLRASDSPSHTPGHDIALTVTAGKTRIEDFMRLATGSSTPLLTGDLAFHAALHIAPGNDTAQQRLQLKGHFDLDQASFTSDKVQQRIQELSARGLGRPGKAKSDPPDPVLSSMHSDFTLAEGIITLPNLDYSVPGADIQLHGTYTMEDGKLSFAGNARMKATVSEMVGGWKGLLLKPADSFFKKDGAGAEFQVHIGGTRDNPTFGVDLNGNKTTSPQSPADRPATHPQSPAQP